MEDSIINPQTGERLTHKSGIKELSEARKVWSMREKMAKSNVTLLTSWMQPHINKAFEEGEKTIAGYWLIQKPRRMFSSTMFKAEATEDDQARRDELKSELEQLEEDYKVVSGEPFLKHPKL